MDSRRFTLVQGSLGELVALAEFAGNARLAVSRPIGRQCGLVAISGMGGRRAIAGGRHELASG